MLKLPALRTISHGMDAGLSSDAELRRLHRAEIGGETMTRSVRNAMAVVFVLNTIFLPLDHLAFPDHSALFVGARLALDVVLAVIFFRTAFTHPTQSAIVSILAMGAMLLTMVAADGGVSSEYTPGLVLLFCGIPVLLPLSALQVAGSVGVLFGVLASLPVFTEIESWRTYFLQVFFPLSGGVVAVGSAMLLDRIRFTDFQRRRELEEARDHLKETDRVKSRFTANVHHELRTPLTLMLAPLEGMLGGDFGRLSELQSGYMKSMHTNGLRLLKLINNLLDLAKIEGKQLEIRRTPLALRDLVEETLRGAGPLAERKGVVLEMSGLEELPDIHVDPEAIVKVLLNLLGNALKFTERGGRIDVRGEATAGDGVHLIVADTGIGIPPEQLGKIFDRFAQVDSSSTRKYEGTGIGLSLVAELVGLHGGRVWAESEGVGRGSQMHVELPHGEPDGGEEEEVLTISTGAGVDLAGSMVAMESDIDFEPANRGGFALADLERNVERSESKGDDVRLGERAEQGPPGAPEVLVVEDNPDMRKLLVFLLEREFRVRSARNGREGLDLAREVRPDLILTDVMMPEMTGTELCRAIKQDPEMCGIPVVLVTSKAEREMKIEGLELGADDYVAKPFHPRELMARVRSLVRVHRLQEEVVERNVQLEESNRDLQRALAELREAEVQLVQAERLAAVGELAAGVAHEVNNPVNYAMNALRALQGYVDDVRAVASQVAAVTGRVADVESPARAQEQLAEIAKVCDERDLDEAADTLAELVGIATEGMQRASRLVGDLRDLGSPGRDEERCPVDVGKELQSTLQLAGRTVNGDAVEMSVRIQDGLPRVEGNRRALNQVFLKLLKNAAEALELGGGVISVVARTSGRDAIVVEIADDGPGIAPEIRERLFDPFFSTKGRGSGLGLSISRRIVSEHGGSVEVESVPGQGTTFAVRLPVEGSMACTAPPTTPGDTHAD